MKSVGDNFLSKVSSEPTRKDVLLGFLFVNREGFMGDVVLGSWLDQGDPERVEFNIFSLTRKSDSRVVTLDFRRSNFKLCSEVSRRPPWESAFEGLVVHKYWSVFKNHILEAQEQEIPLCHKSSKRGTRPAWLNRELLAEPKKRNKLYDHWK